MAEHEFAPATQLSTRRMLTFRVLRAANVSRKFNRVSEAQGFPERL